MFSLYILLIILSLTIVALISAVLALYKENLYAHNQYLKYHGLFYKAWDMLIVEIQENDKLIKELNKS